MAAYNTEGLIGGRLKLGNTEYELTEIRYGVNGDLIWPTAYIATLTPSWTYAGQYTLDTIPAAGGTAYVTWTLTIVRASDQQQVYSGTVTPNVTLSDTTNFGYSSAAWTAQSRGRNGINATSGTTAPTSAPARSCTLSASYSTTYNNVTVSASWQGTMTQAKNDAHAGAVSYSNIRFTLSKYNTSSSPAPASRTTDATVDAKADRSTAYTFDSGLAYTYNESNAVTSSGFTFSSDNNWASISGTSVTVASRGTTEGNARSTTLRAAITGATSNSATVTLYQAANTKTTTYTYVYTGLSVWASPSSLGSTDTSFSVYGTLAFTTTPHYSYSSGSSTDGTSYNDSVTVTPTITSVSPTPTSISGRTVTIPQNTGTSTITYSFSASYTDPNGRTWTASSSVQQSAVSYTYTNPVVSIYYDQISAAGGTAYPHISFTQKRTSSLGEEVTITGSLSGGAMSGTASDGSHFTVTINGTSVSPGTFYSSDGRVTVGSRGTTAGDARNVAKNITATINCNYKTGYNSTSAVATQQANVATATPASNVCTALTLTLSPSPVSSAVATTVTVTAKATGTSTAARVDYTSGEHTGGEVTTYTNQTVTLESLTVNGEAQSSTSSFSASNLHSTSTKTWTASGTYAGKSASASVTQAADQQSDWLTRDYAVSISIASNNVTAAGGSFTVSASGSHTKYKKWLSDNTDVTGTVSTVTDTPSLSLVSMSSSGAFTISGSTVSHRNMTNNETTDSVKVRATNGSVTADTSAVSVTNSKTYGTVSLTYTGSQYIVASGGAVPFTASCPITWTSGYNDPGLSTSDFTFSFRSKGNSSKRTYTFEDGTGTKIATFGSLGTNEVTSEKDTVVKATHSSAGSAEKTLTERVNIITNKTLTVNWNITGMPSSGKMSGMGGTLTVKVSSASIQSTYSSGASTSPTSVTASTILNNTTASGTGFTFTHTYGSTTSTLKAVYNPSTSASRDCVLTVSYSNATATKTITQDHINHEVSYETQSGTVKAYIKNTDNSNSHSFTYNVIYDGTEIVPETTSTWSAGEKRQVGGGQTGHILTAQVSKEDGVSRVTS